MVEDRYPKFAAINVHFSLQDELPMMMGTTKEDYFEFCGANLVEEKYEDITDEYGELLSERRLDHDLLGSYVSKHLEYMYVEMKKAGGSKLPRDAARTVANITIKCVIRRKLREQVCEIDWASEG